MKISAYEKMTDSVRANSAKQQADNTKRAAAAAEVADAHKRLDGVLDQAVAGQDLAVEVGKAQGALAIAQEKERRLLAQLNEATGPKPVFTAHSVKSEVQQQIRDGRLIEELQPLLDDLNEMRRQYREKMKELIVQRNRVNTELRFIQIDATGIEHRRIEGPWL